MNYKASDINFKLLSRFIELEELGFRECTDVDETGHHQVYTISNAENGFRFMEILTMSEPEFQSLKDTYTN